MAKTGRKPPKFDATGRACVDCKIWKSWDEFYNAPKGFQQKQPYCKICAKKRVYIRLEKQKLEKQQQAENPEQIENQEVES